MNCKEFKQKYAGKFLLAFLVENYTHIYRFNAEYVTYFIRRHLPEVHPDWKKVYFYSITRENESIIVDGKITKFEDKATFLNLVASRKEQTELSCVFSPIFRAPNMKLLEGKRAKVTTLSMKS